MKAEARAKGKDIIDFGIGDPDIPTPKRIIDTLCKTAYESKNHRYPSYEGLIEFRSAVSIWYKSRFNIDLVADAEVVSLIGSKEGIAHFPLAIVNHQDTVLIPSPAYPVYRVATLFAGGIPYTVPLTEGNLFLPDLESIPNEVKQSARLIFINYPNNPTSVMAGRTFFEHVVEFAHRYNIIVCHDAAYTEIYYEEKPMSFLEIEGAKDVGIEFHSLSKTFNMTGWRIGFAVGNKTLVEALGKVKTNIDSGVFQAIQYAGIEALANTQSAIEETRVVYEERKNVMTEGLKSMGIEVFPCMASFYLWCKVPKGFTSASFCSHLLKEAAIVFTPGNGFGEEGEGYFRIALTVGVERMKEALERIRKVGL